MNSGILDDWSIARSAQVLAETGHIQYNGWEAPILGWQLYAGALFIKLFGFSFTVLRSVNMLEALLLVFLAQRVFVRAGIREWNAAFGALTLALCPVFFTSSLLFMTDVPGTLAVIVCLYCCIRALQAVTNRASSAWIVAAALLNAVLGTTRQTAWLGLLVMVPCALWLLRRRSAVAIAGIVAWICGLGLMVAVLHWFNHQPYTLPEHVLYSRFPWKRAVAPAVRTLCRIFFDLLLLTLPLSLALIPKVRLNRRSLRAMAATVVVFLLALALLYGRAPHHDVLAPFLLTPTGVQPPETMVLSFPTPILGPSPGHLTLGFRVFLTVLDLISLLVLAATAANLKLPASGKRALPGRHLFVLTVPYAAAYLLMLMPRAVLIFTVERYLMFLLPIAVLGLLWLYESTGATNIRAFGVIPLCVIGLYSTFLLHDVFATYRANLMAVEEVRAAGIRRTSISGGIEYNFMTQVTLRGYTPAPGIRMPDGSVLPLLVPPPPRPCTQGAIEYMPVVHPDYAIAYPSANCEAVTQFAPVAFTTWLSPHHRTALVVRYGVPGPTNGAAR